MWRPMMIPIFGVRDVREAALFYRDQLGFDLDPENGLFVPFGDEAVYAILKREGLEIHLQIRRSDVPSVSRGPLDRDAYGFVGDAKALLEEFSSRDVRVIQDLLETPYGMLEFAIEDPFGFRIAFGSELPT